MTVGRENFCQDWERDTLLRINHSDGNTSFARFVPARDPDMTVHEDINKILLQESSQSAKRKLELPQVSSENCIKSVENSAEELHVSHAENIEQEAIAVLDPEDVSKTFSEIRDENCDPEEPNCSAIGGSQVKTYINISAAMENKMFFFLKKWLSN